jgi:hypothetical protein
MLSIDLELVYVCEIAAVRLRLRERSYLEEHDEEEEDAYDIRSNIATWLAQISNACTVFLTLY